MTIIQKHGSRETLKQKPDLLKDYQFGYAVADGDYLGELFIKENGDVHPITDQVKNEILDEVHVIEGNILSKIGKGKIKAFDTLALLIDYIEADNNLEANKRQLEANYQFIVKHDENHDNDTVLWVIFDREDGKEYDFENEAIEVGSNLVAEPVTKLDFTYHDPRSVDGVNRSDYATEDAYIKASKEESFGIAVGEVDEDGNTIDIGLTTKTTDFLKALNGLGLVGSGNGTDIFSEGFVNGISVEANPVTDIERADGKTVQSGVKISFNKKIKNADGVWGDDSTELILNLDDLVIDEGSWA